MFLALVVGGFFGCVSSPDPYSITVDAERAKGGIRSGGMRYAIVYTDQTSMDIMNPLNERLRGAMTDLGYELAPYKNADVILRIVAAQDMRKAVMRNLSAAETGMPANPDSIRFKNVAAMVGGGRYKQLLNDNPNAPGEIIMGPQGESIATGNLRDRPIPGAPPQRRVVRKFNRLELSVMETSASVDAAVDGIRWRVEVVSELAPTRPSPDMFVLLEAAMAELRDPTGGKP